MKKLLVVFAIAGASLAQTPPPATYKSGAALLADVLQKAKAAPTEQVSSAIANEEAYRMSFVHRNTPGIAMAHATGPAKGTEIHYIIEGSATVITGGTITRPAGAPAGRGGPAPTIEGGVTHHLVKGDVLVIPAGTPHWYKEVTSPVTYLEVRFDVEKK